MALQLQVKRNRHLQRQSGKALLNPSRKAGRGGTWFPFGWGTLFVPLAVGWLWHLLPVDNDALGDLGMCGERCTGLLCPTAGLHWELPGSCVQTVRSTSPLLSVPNLPASWADVEQCGELAKMGSRAWHTPGLSDLRLPVSHPCSGPQHFASLLPPPLPPPPLLFHKPFAPLSPGLFPLPAAAVGLVPGRPCKAFHAPGISTSQGKPRFPGGTLEF